MIIKCKVENPDCPVGVDVCCGICDQREACDMACKVSDHMACPDVEVITNELTAFQSAVPDSIAKITTLIRLKKGLEEQEKKLKQMLVEAMEKYNVKAFENDQIKMTYVAPTTKNGIDSTRLKKDHPDIAKEYTKTSPVASYVKVSMKG